MDLIVTAVGASNGRAWAKARVAEAPELTTRFCTVYSAAGEPVQPRLGVHPIVGWAFDQDYVSKTTGNPVQGRLIAFLK